MTGKTRQTSVQSAANTSFLRLVFSTAATKFESSQAFMLVRSMGFWLGKTACNSGMRAPLKDSAATVVRMVGTLKTLAAFARPIVLFSRVWRSMDWIPKNIWGWWSMKIRAQLSGVSNPWIHRTA
ncbi:hypothetical protein D3C86_1149610 [compost metagenome]